MQYVLRYNIIHFCIVFQLPLTVASGGRRNNCGELCLAALPADLESIDVESGAECDIVRVLQQEMDLEGRVDLDCLRNFVTYTNI